MPQLSNLSLSGIEWDLSGAIEVPPQTRRELWQWTHAYCRTPEGQRINIPTRRICQGHNAPMEFYGDAYFGQDINGNPVGNQFLHTNRNGGKTLLLGTLSQVATYHKGRGKYPLNIVNAAAIEDQAKKCLSYSASLWGQPEFIPHVGKKGILKTGIFLPNGSSLEIKTATFSGMNSPHVPWLHIDEWELWDWVVGQQGFSIPKTMGPHRAATRIVSTQKFALGNMQKFKAEAAQKGFKSYKWCIWETIEGCKDRSCSSCPIFSWPDAQGGELCGGRAKHAVGFYSIDDFIDKVLMLDRKTLKEEWLCTRPSRQGLVYGDEYNEDLHVIRQRIPYTPGLPIEIAIDQGFTNPFAVLFIQDNPGKDQTRFIDELYERGRIPEEMGRLTAAKLYKLGVKPGQIIVIVPDPEDPAAAKTFAGHLEHKLPNGEIVKYYGALRYPSGRMDYEERLRLCRRRLKVLRGLPPRMIIGSGLTWFPWEFTQYCYPVKLGEENPHGEKPVDKDNHCQTAWQRWEHYKIKPAEVQTGESPISY